MAFWVQCSLFWLLEERVVECDTNGLEKKRKMVGAAA